MSFLDKLKGLLGKESLDVLARYELLREAVSGTMSSFYMARDRETDRIVGLKIADQEKLTAFEARFKGLKKPSEGEIAINLKHPHVVETFDYGTTKNGLRFLVMEFLEGQGLHALINDEDTILEGKRLQLIREMAEAIDYVHEQGFIHRDICPRNFICEPDASSLKLIDFGLSLPATEPFMMPGNRTGTPAYMAPEVSRRQKTDQRLDMFSFGMTAYQLCAFELPWPVSDKPAMSALAYSATPPEDLLRYAPQLNNTLAQAIMQCLSPSPNQRPQTGGEFVRMIREVESDNEP
ncbi:MAG: serine/threonine protein kinase [Planctomycetes bacterium]|nr:serine/threonine protein kinase [Planctomycetota bacterium]